MPKIHAILRRINRNLGPQFEERPHAFLADEDREGLIEQSVRLTLDAPSLEEMDRKHIREETRRRKNGCCLDTDIPESRRIIIRS